MTLEAGVSDVTTGERPLEGTLPEGDLAKCGRRHGDGDRSDRLATNTRHSSEHERNRARYLRTERELLGWAILVGRKRG